MLPPKPPAEKGSCTPFHVCVESRLVCTYPAECVLGFACQPHSANPVWRLVNFSLCGVGLWYIKEHWGLAPSGSLAVWFDAAALSLGDPLGRVSSNPRLLQGLRAGTVWDRCLELLATQRVSSHGGLEKPCTAFYHSALRGPFFIPDCCSWFPLSSSLKGVSVSLHQFFLSIPVSSVLPPLTQALRSWCSKTGWVQSSKIPTKLLIYSYQTAFSFLTSWLMRSAPCMGISSIHCVIPIDPICSLVP